MKKDYCLLLPNPPTYSYSAFSAHWGWTTFMLCQSQSLHPCKVPLILFHLLRNPFCTSLSSCNQHHRFRLDGRAPMRSQTHSHVSLMITFLESHLGQNSLRKNGSVDWLSPAGLFSSFPGTHHCNCFRQLSVLSMIKSDVQSLLQLTRIFFFFLAVLGVHCCAGFSLVAVSRGSPQAAAHSLLVVAASFCSSWALEHRPSGCGTQA